MISFVKSGAVIFLLSLIRINAVSSALYKELRDLGGSCFPRDSCQCGHYQTHTFNGEKTCECDPTCYRRGTCCIDSPYADSRLSNRNEVCSGKRRIGNYYYFTKSPSGKFFEVRKCDLNWHGPSRVINLCEMEEPVDGTDFMFEIPVTNIRSGISYKNYYCALCNKDIEGAVIWDVQIHEDGSYKHISELFTVEDTDGTYERSDHTPGNSSSSCSSSSTSLTLVYNEDKRSYGYWDYCSNDAPSFVSIAVDLSIPDQIQHLVKSCRSDLVSSCPPDWTDIRVKVLCESYLGIIKGPRRVTEYNTYYDRYFRNAHCALCNNVTNFDEYDCDSFYDRPILTPAYPTSFTLLLAHQLADEGCLGDHEKYVKGLGCRAVICRKKMKKGKCTV